MLKKVLKEYCAPIPEENEDITPPEDKKASNSSTNIVMVMNTVNDNQLPTLETVTSKLEESSTEVNTPLDLPQRPESPRAVSPFTKA